MKKPACLILGLLSLAVGALGAVLPLLPTTPFLILAAFFFARSNPAWEARLLAHPQVGPAIAAWRDHGAIPIAGKRLATVLLGISTVVGWTTLPGGWAYVPVLVGVPILAWMWSRPSV